LSTYA